MCSEMGRNNPISKQHLKGSSLRDMKRLSDDCSSLVVVVVSVVWGILYCYRHVVSLVGVLPF